MNLGQMAWVVRDVIADEALRMGASANDLDALFRGEVEIDDLDYLAGECLDLVRFAAEITAETETDACPFCGRSGAAPEPADRATTHPDD